MKKKAVQDVRKKTIKPKIPVDKLLANWNKASKTETRVVLYATGHFAPVHNGHVALMMSAKKHLEKENMHVMTGLFSPTSDETAQARSEHFCAIHRVHMLKLVTKNSDWMDVETWQAAQSKPMLPCTAANHVSDILHNALKDKPFTFILVCGFSTLSKIPILALKPDTVQVVCVTTSNHLQEANQIAETYAQNNIKFRVIVDNDLPENITNAALRVGLKNKSSEFEHMIPKSVINYMKQNLLATDVETDELNPKDF